MGQHTSSSIGKGWPYLDFKGKTKGGFRPHFGPLFWQDLWSDCFTTNWLRKKSGVFLITHALRKRRDLDKGCVLVICPLNLIQSNHLRSLTQHDVPACSLSQDCRVNTASGLQHSVEDVKVGKFDLIFAHPEALFNTMEEEALLFDKGFQKLITAVVVIQSGHGNLDICVSIFIMCPLALSWKKSTYQHIETKTFRRQFQMHILEWKCMNFD